MLKDITFGQYFPTGSAVHAADPRTKIILLVVFIVFVFVAGNMISLGLLTVSMLALMALSRIPVKMYLKNIKTILPVIIFTSILNALYVSSGDVLFKWWIITVTTDGVWRAVFMTLRIIMLILSSSMFSYTTTPTAITNAIEQLLSPLKYLGLQSAVHTMAMTMTIALRFIPTLIEETEIIMNAQKARGANLGTGSLMKRIKALLPILIPLLISSVKRAYDLAEAMECRCYNGAEGRQRMKQLKMGRVDAVAFTLLFVVFTGVILINVFFQGAV